ncbi:potential E3 ubiquitin-protein ligase ariadne-2 [Capsella rubella]|nr:potential E3 ubiquitin-protein ligase ariadne-2 [Capsella rubella]
MYRLYFKGFVNDETNGFGVAICDQQDNLLYHIKGSRHHEDSTITVLEAELTALKRGLTEAVSVGIKHISLYCDHDQIFELVLGISPAEKDTIALHVDDVQRIRQQFTSSTPVLMTRNQAKFAYNLAMETTVSEISIDRSDQRKTCSTCFKNDEHMFSVDSCDHQFCMKCVKGHIEAGLLEGSEMRCPNNQCESELTLTSCANLLTQELREIWEQRIKSEETVLVVETVRCPNPKCSALMSKTGDGTMRCCYKCRKPFCINCKVEWHSNMSCEEYKRLGLKRLGLNHTTTMLRACRECKNVIELPKNRVEVITCRCGYEFCYTCETEWTGRGCAHRKMKLADWLPSLVMISTCFVVAKIFEYREKL